MFTRDSILTGVIVTAVTLLIWFLAAAETREEADILRTVRFDVTGEGRWRTVPESRTVKIRVEGSPAAIDKALETLPEPLTVELLGEVDTQAVNLVERLADLDAIEATGVSVLSADPRTFAVEVDEIRVIQAQIRSRLPATLRLDELSFDPPVATLEIPGRTMRAFRVEPVVDARLPDPSIVDELEPGVRHTVRVRLTPPPGLPAEDVELSPGFVNASFTLRSRIRTSVRNDVRVHLAGPHKDYREYDIELEPAVLRDVVIRAESDLIDRIEKREATVVAVVHLSNRDKANFRESKPVAYYLVLEKDWEAGRTIEVQGDPRTIGLKITRRE